jgi:hypothetical protein
MAELCQRDIHPNNVLVQYEYFANSNSVSHHVVLSDLGEGKEIAANLKPETRAVSTIPEDIDLGQYQAPEVEDEGYSKMSDIFSWAQLGTDIIRRSYDKLADQTGRVRYPAKLLHLLETCLDDDPRERYEAPLLSYMLDEVVGSLRDDDADAVEWREGDYELRQVAKRLSMSLELPPSWMES